MHHWTGLVESSPLSTNVRGVALVWMTGISLDWAH